jgi:ABC-2 type transport system ATP-binding protein
MPEPQLPGVPGAVARGLQGAGARAALADQTSAVRLEHLTKIYDAPPGSAGGSGIVAANHLDLDIPPGEIFGLVGPNGAGKTTTLKMICGLLVPTAGRIAVHGVDVERDPEKALGLIGYLADFFSLYEDLTVREYLDYFAAAYKVPPSAANDRVAEVIGIVGLEDKRNAMIAALSRGMKQRVAIARAIVHDPAVLVLDEPAVGLDPAGRIDFRNFVTAFRDRGKTVIITSHLLHDLEEICTLVAFIQQGRVVRVGRLDAFLRDAAGIRTMRIRIASPAFPLTDWLSARRGVSRVTAGPDGAQCSLTGGEIEAAALVRDLVLAGAAVYAVEEVSDSLEAVVTRLSQTP